MHHGSGNHFHGIRSGPDFILVTLRLAARTRLHLNYFRFHVGSAENRERKGLTSAVGAPEFSDVGIKMSHRTFCNVVIFALAFAVGYHIQGAPIHAAPPLTRTAVLVELFTSEGCSSCPPADRVLAQLSEQQLVGGVDVIAMSEHVDYWNQLGWSDPFSAPQFSARQNQYAKAFRHADVYTPQMVIDGQMEFVGSDVQQAIRAVTHAAQKPKGSVTIELVGHDIGTVKLQVSVDPIHGMARGEWADVFLAVTEDNLSSSVERGENRGRKLAHVAVVRSLSQIGSLDEAGSFTSAPAVRVARQWKAIDLRAIAFVQARTDRRILAVASVPIEGHQ